MGSLKMVEKMRKGAPRAPGKTRNSPAIKLTS